MIELSRATVSRLPHYLRLLEDLGSTQITVSSDSLAKAAGVNAANVRRDLSDLGFQGTRGVGYSVPALRDRIRRELGIETRRQVAIIGAGNLGTALARYYGLGPSGFDVIAAYDADPSRIGQKIDDLTIQHLNEMAIDCRIGCFDMAILTVPAEAAQTVTNKLVESGIKSILNFAPTRVTVPPGVAVREVDLATELQILSYYG
ncbi:MAG: redox-sensing transcriptional repressor Rex [Actinomycetota bacterium]|nr:redox-sensing transcriptional repressor Rex [Actinomycetota bacterium]